MPKPPEDLDDILASLDEFQSGACEEPDPEELAEAAEGAKTQAVNDFITEEMTVAAPKLPTKTIAQLVKNTEAIVPSDPMAQISDMLIGIKNEFDNISGEILGTWRSDRDQTQTVIDYLLGEVRGNSDPPRVFVEGLVKLLEVKANTSITAVKLLDAKTRLLQAIKGGAGVVINNTANAAAGASNGELTRLLSEPAASDFEGD